MISRIDGSLSAASFISVVAFRNLPRVQIQRELDHFRLGFPVSLDTLAMLNAHRTNCENHSLRTETLSGLR
jgi:hypothetical protein